jgi:hypothetical protein
MTEFEFLLPVKNKQTLKEGDILKNEIITDVWIDINGKENYPSKKLSRIWFIKSIQKWFYKKF